MNNYPLKLKSFNSCLNAHCTPITISVKNSEEFLAQK